MIGVIGPLQENSHHNFQELILSLPGPILVVGAGGFIGSNLLSAISNVRADVSGVIPDDSSDWRIQDLKLLSRVHRSSRESVTSLVDSLSPRTLFNLAAHGAYEAQRDIRKILESNLEFVLSLSEWANTHACRFIQAGSSSEYGVNSLAPREEHDLPKPNSLYAVTKLSASLWLENLARTSDFNGVTLRLYSVFGRYEEPTRLVPTLIREGRLGRLPAFTRPQVSRDFVYIDDVIEAFVLAAHFASSTARGRTINICTGVQTTMKMVSEIAREEFGLDCRPEFGGFSRNWDLDTWVGDASLASQCLQWEYRTSFSEGLHLTSEFYSGGRQDLLQVGVNAPSAKMTRDDDITLSVVVACYKDEQAIPVMYNRVKAALETSGHTFELIFVNDASPDNTLQIIEDLSSRDDRVLGITHSRNFGSQAAFLSGMEMAKGRHVALLDGDLQDPPELLPEMLSLTQQGFDVAFGRRVSRETSVWMQMSYKIFYRVFSQVSPFAIPHDAGDFSVMSRPVVNSILEMPERDLFIRAQRAFVGFRQIGVDYVRPERVFGTSTNNIRRNVGWAMRGFLSVTRVPLTVLSVIGVTSFLVALLLVCIQVITKLFVPDIAPDGLATVSILILSLGALNVLGLAILGEYVGRILDETKRRPRFIRRLITQSGISQGAGLGTSGSTGDS